MISKSISELEAISDVTLRLDASVVKQGDSYGLTGLTTSIKAHHDPALTKALGIETPQLTFVGMGFVLTVLERALALHIRDVCKSHKEAMKEVVNHVVKNLQNQLNISDEA